MSKIPVADTETKNDAPSIVVKGPVNKDNKGNIKMDRPSYLEPWSLPGRVAMGRYTPSAPCIRMGWWHARKGRLVRS